MTSKKDLKAKLASLIREAVREGGGDRNSSANIAASVNVNRSGGTHRVRSTQRVIQKDGVTTVTESREES